MSIIEQLRAADPISQGWFVAVAGLAGVFLLLVIFFIAIKIFQKIGKKQPADHE
jgi:hypothetical protein